MSWLSASPVGAAKTVRCVGGAGALATARDVADPVLGCVETALIPAVCSALARATARGSINASGEKQAWGVRVVHQRSGAEEALGTCAQ